LPLGLLVLLITLPLFLSILSIAGGRLQLIAKRRSDLLIHSIYTASRIRPNPTSLRRYVLALGQHPGISSISVYSDTTSKVIASTEQDLLGKSLNEIPKNEIMLSEILEIRKNRNLTFIDRGDDIVHVAGPLPKYSRKGVPRNLLNTIVFISLYRSYMDTIVGNLAMWFITILFLEISILSVAVILISNHVVIKPAKELLRTLAAWDAGKRPVPSVHTLDELGNISKHLYKTLRALDESNQAVNDITKAINHHAIVSIADKRGKITYVNDKFCEASKYPREELIGEDHRIVNSGYHPKEFIRELWQTIVNGQVWNQDMKNRAKDGSEYWVATTIVPFLDQTGKPTQYISIRTDITSTKQAELVLQKNEIKLGLALKAAEAATYAKSQFLANMSHEIRTPLTSIIGFAEAAREEGVSTEDRMQSLDRILNSGEHLLGIINDILDLSKIDAGALKVEMQPFSPVALLQSVKTLMLPRISEKGLNLTINYIWPLPATITNDSLRLMQILVNLVSNAIKFTESGQVTISVRCEKQSQRINFSISDTGIGINADQIDRLFLPFSQTDSGATRRFGGTGLGLFISKNLITLLGGEISVQSQPNFGSTFSFSITTNDTSNTEWIYSIPQIKPSVEVDRSIISKMRGRVLVVDDAADNRALIEFSLRNSKIAITMAENGQEAVKATQAQEFDLIIMDMQMPVMDGYEATRTLRQNGVTTPIVAFTAAILKNDILKCTEAGCSSHLTKPFNQNSLVQCLSKYLFLDIDQTANPKIEITRTPTQKPDARSIHLGFINGLENRINDISNAFNERDFTRLKNATHKLAGTAGLFGYPALARICAQLENVFRDNDPAICLTLLEQINQAYSAIMNEAQDIKNEETYFNDIGQRVPKDDLGTQH
jgi:PAS domain S-box-containing protein